jgi:DNA-binding transcriptional regulator YhcF (GntR family)
MRLWINRQSEVTIREQLETQIRQAVLSGDLAAGERLPSTREIGRRFAVHPNTVSTAYVQLEREGWLRASRGSGMFVRSQIPAEPLSAELAVGRLIAKMAAEAADLGASAAMVRAGMRQWLAAVPPTRWMVVEPDKQLRRIVQRELTEKLSLPVDGCSLEECRMPRTLEAVMVVALPTKEAIVREMLPASVPLTILQTSSIPFSLAQYLPAPEAILVGVASCWPGFLQIAETMLTAAGLPAECLVLRDTSKHRWQRGLKETVVVISDVITAARVPAGCRTICFRLVNEATLARLKQAEAQLEQVEVL